MFRITFLDNSRLKAFLSVSATEFVDVFCQKGQAYFVSDTNEIFAMLICQAASVGDGNSIVFRIRSQLLKAVSGDSMLEVQEECDGRICIRFMAVNGYLYYTCHSPKQVVFSTAYQDKVALCAKTFEGGEINVKACSELIRIAKSQGTFLSVSSGVVSVILRNGYRIYKRVSTSEAFAATGMALSTLQKCSDTIYSVKNYLLAREEGLCVLAKKSILQDNDEYAVLVSGEYKAKCVFCVDLVNVFRFMDVFGGEVERIVVCPEKAACCIDSGGMVFDVNVGVSGLKVAEGACADDLELSVSFLRNVLGRFKESKFMVKQKRNYVQLEQGGLLIVW